MSSESTLSLRSTQDSGRLPPPRTLLSANARRVSSVRRGRERLENLRELLPGIERLGYNELASPAEEANVGLTSKRFRIGFAFALLVLVFACAYWLSIRVFRGDSSTDASECASELQAPAGQGDPNRPPPPSESRAFVPSSVTEQARTGSRTPLRGLGPSSPTSEAASSAEDPPSTPRSSSAKPPEDDTRLPEPESSEEPFDLEAFDWEVNERHRAQASGLDGHSPAERTFREDFGNSFRESELSHAAWDCVRMTFELREDINEAMLIYELHYTQLADHVAVELAAVRTDVLEQAETDCILDSAPSLNDLATPTWLAEGQTHVVEFPSTFYDRDHPSQVEMRRRWGNSTPPPRRIRPPDER